MKFLAGSLLALATVVSGTAVNLNKRDTPLDVKLEMVGNSEVKATLTNNGDAALKLFKVGSILDKTAVEKAEVNSPESRVAFEGIRLRMATENLDEDAFQSLAAGESVEVQFDIAEAHDLSQGGAFDILSEGAISYAEEGSTAIAGAVPYTSNKISATVDGTEAKKVREEFVKRTVKRTAVNADCTGTRRTATVNAVTNCRSLALAASSAAASGSASKFQEYFKTTSASTRSQVAAVFGRVASECGSTTSGVSDYYCTDVYGNGCQSGVLAYTLPSASYMVNCPLYFSGLSATSRTCHAQDQQTTTLHEMTHLSEIAGTTDQNGAYGYNAVRSLTAAQNLRHADTYTLYAQAIYAGC
ncbi:Peptidase M35 deuterolysin [Lasiodiplodia theobromae]|uniref:Neutral protease 2 n=1 Tax=Lasiodiplodia hormozganensis TaxID=869390 RepID=A0AA39Z2K8_9PEZI|nr:Peptidase M35 deuterolysin [Lasiodiplodia theobromae]KAK0662620.1 Neutral protease 2-like protein [Lasiodiplodia hormozganensis]